MSFRILKPNKSRSRDFLVGKDIMLNRSTVFLVIHAVILLGLFGLRLLGVAADIILLIAAAVISMEAIYMAVFTKDAASSACRTVKQMEAEILPLKESASETVKLQRALIYTGHQIKTIQQELDFLKKKAELKSNGNGNGHSRRAHHPIISHS